MIYLVKGCSLTGGSAERPCVTMPAAKECAARFDNPTPHSAPYSKSLWNQKKNRGKFCFRAAISRGHYLCRLLLTLKHPTEQLDIFGKRRIKLTKFIYLAYRMDDRGVIAAPEFTAYFRQ